MTQKLECKTCKFFNKDEIKLGIGKCTKNNKIVNELGCYTCHSFSKEILTFNYLKENTELKDIIYSLKNEIKELKEKLEIHKQQYKLF